MSIESQALLCPRDATPLEIVVWEAWQYGSCPSCHGIYIERSELERLCYAHDASPPDDIAPVGEGGIEAADDPVRCSCEGRPVMRRVTREGLAIDVCSHCGAHWFDADEIERYFASRAHDSENEGIETRLGVERVPRDMIRGFFRLWLELV